MSKPYEKTAEQLAAEKNLADIIGTTAPKGIGQGLSTGVGNIVGAAIGAAGVAVLAPTLGKSIAPAF